MPSMQSATKRWLFLSELPIAPPPFHCNAHAAPEGLSTVTVQGAPATTRPHTPLKRRPTLPLFGAPLRICSTSSLAAYSTRASGGFAEGVLRAVGSQRHDDHARRAVRRGRRRTRRGLEVARP